MNLSVLGSPPLFDPFQAPSFAWTRILQTSSLASSHQPIMGGKHAIRQRYSVSHPIVKDVVAPGRQHPIKVGNAFPLCLIMDLITNCAFAKTTACIAWPHRIPTEYVPELSLNRKCDLATAIIVGSVIISDDLMLMQYD
jgi:hypothetical protein